MQSIANFGSGYGVSGEVILNKIMEGSEEGAVKRIDDFAKQIQRLSINKPAATTTAKPKATTTKMNAQGKVTPASKTPSFQ
jgi:hypothetical protein